MPTHQLHDDARGSAVMNIVDTDDVLADDVAGRPRLCQDIVDGNWIAFTEYLDGNLAPQPPIVGSPYRGRVPLSEKRSWLISRVKTRRRASIERNAQGLQADPGLPCELRISREGCIEKYAPLFGRTACRELA